MSDPVTYSLFTVFDAQFLKTKPNPPNITDAFCRMIDSPAVTKLLFFHDGIANLKKNQTRTNIPQKNQQNKTPKHSLITEVLNPVMHKCFCSDN